MAIDEARRDARSAKGLTPFLQKALAPEGRRVFDAVWSHIAGSARGMFNERFGMPVAGSVLLTPTSFPFQPGLALLVGVGSGVAGSWIIWIW
jgi:hypothetical protein